MPRPAAALAAGLLTVATAVAAPAVAAPAPLGQQDTWSVEQADVPDARAAGRDGEGVLVAVLDSWVDRTHPDFTGRALEGVDCVGGPCRPGQTSDDCDHGTHVAGTVAATSFGVAPRARVLPVRVLSYDPATGDCTGRPEDVAAGVREALRRGARVLNLSLGADVPALAESGAIPRAVDEAAAAGAVVVFSAGNDERAGAETYGGQAVVVAATGPSGRLASYSAYGPGVTLAAPGGDPTVPGTCTQADCVTSLYPGGRYAVAAGTSMAAPTVSGVAALLLAQDPSRSRSQVVAALVRTARPLAGGGAGLVDAAAALGVRPPVPRPSSTPAPPSVQPDAVAPPVDPLPVAPLPGDGAVAVVAVDERRVPLGTAALALALLVGVGSGVGAAARGRRA